MRGEQERHKQEHTDERKRFKRARKDVESSAEEEHDLFYTPNSAVQDSRNVCVILFQRKGILVSQ